MARALAARIRFSPARGPAIHTRRSFFFPPFGGLPEEDISFWAGSSAIGAGVPGLAFSIPGEATLVLPAIVASDNGTPGLLVAGPGVRMSSSNAIPRKTRELHNHHFDSTIWNDLRFRDDDVAIATYAKAGTTWTQQIVAQLLFGGDPELAGDRPRHDTFRGHPATDH